MKSATLAFILAVQLLPAIHAQTSITGSIADYELAPGPVLGSTTATTTRAGASNAASNPGLRNLVYIFALPAAPSGQVVTSAKLSFTYVSKSGTPTLNADLWGIGFQASTTPILKALSANTDSDGVKVQNNVIEPTTALGRITSGNFASYLHEFYLANPGYTGGTYSFFRLNGDASSTSAIGYNCAMANNAGNEPVLTLEFGTPLADVHPRLMAGPGDRARILENIRTVPWFATAYNSLYSALGTNVNRHRSDPDWILARMAMNWVTKYTTDTVASERWSGGAGSAPVPTPRFSGARDWSTIYSLDSVSSTLPYNDDPAGTGKIWMRNTETGISGWTNPGLTGAAIENMNETIMAQARDAAFVWWLTGEEAYAKFAADIFWQFWQGFSFKQSPPNGAGTACGSFTFEVIHDEIIRASAITYDFLHPYLVAQGKDTALIEAQLKRVADREIVAGNPTGNWNVIESMFVTYLALALQPDASYADAKGREYYVNQVLHAASARQTGLATVIATEYDQATALWPEAFGYGTGVTDNMLEVLTLLDRSGYGSEYLTSGILPRAALVQFQMLYPSGWAANCGDTNHTRVATDPIELLALAAQRRGDATTLAQMTGAIQQATNVGGYDRTANRGILPLCFFLGDVPTSPTTPPTQSRHFYAAPLNQWVMRTPAPDARFALGSSLAGTAGGHSQNQGLAMELYGTGMIIAPDPNRGESYWTPDYTEYIDKPPSHNAVIVGGKSTAGGAFTTRAVEPASTAAPVSPNFGFVYADLSNSSPSSVSADQRRLLVNVLTGDTSGFYFDIFRSKLKSTTAPSQSHDYLYHSLGLSMNVTAVSGTTPAFATSSVLTSANGNQAGYDYFFDEQSAALSGDFKTVFNVDTGNPATAATMTTWMLGQPDRTVFQVNALHPRGAGAFPSNFNNLDMPTLIVRQNNNAWTNPFIAVFEPSLNSAGPKVTAVQPLGAFSTGNTIMVAVDSQLGDPALADTTYLFSDDSGARQTTGNIAFKGVFGAIQVREGAVSELYLGNGFEVTSGAVGVKAVSTSVATAASLRPAGGDWFCAANAPVTVTLPRPDGHLPHVTLDDGATQTIAGSLFVNTGADGATYSFTVPAGRYTIRSEFSLPTTHQSEDTAYAAYGGGVTLDNNNAGFNGTGFINFPTTGGFLQFTNINGGAGGNATLSIRYALGSSARTGLLIVNGVSQPMTFAGTGGWTTWARMLVSVALNSGATNTIRFETNGQDLGNIDEIAVAPPPTVLENWRLAYFGTMSNSGNGADTADPDGDGWTNAQEFSAGTNPNDRSSLLKVSEMIPSGSDLLVRFPTVTGKTYRLERSAALQAGSWTTVRDNVAGTGGTVPVADTGGAAQPQRFYRIVVQ